MRGIKHFLLYGLLVFLVPKLTIGQQNQPMNTKLSLDQILDYALENSPMIQQSLLDEEIRTCLAAINSSLQKQRVWFDQT